MPEKFLLALLAFTALASVLLFGPPSFGPGGQSAEAVSFNEVKKLLASDAQVDIWFGYSVALSGDTAVVGAQREDELATNAGAAYVFQRAEGGADNWGQVKKLTASDAEADDRFGSSVAVSGDTIVVGAYREDAGGSFAGAVYVFQRDEGGTNSWGEVKKLTASDADFGDRFGWSVAIDIDTAIFGAPHENAGGSFAGAVYVFQRDEGGANNWGEVKKITASDAQALTSFGWSVAVSGDTAIVGAYREDAGGTDAGAAYVFQRKQGGANDWGEVRKITASDAQAGDEFGQSVAVSGDTAVVGARYEDAGGTDAGAAYVFQRNEGGADNWGEVKKLTASDAEIAHHFGDSVAVSGDTVIVGAPWGNPPIAYAGAGYVFHRNEGGADNWGEVRRLTASDADVGDEFGYSVAVSGDTIVVGAYREDAGGILAGAVYVFDLLQPKSTPTPTKQPDPGDTDGDGCSDQRENGPDETQGGQRDYLNPWDFYDVDSLEGGPDGYIDLLFDILGVIFHYSLDGSPPYDVQFDRGPTSGPNPWNMTAPDGSIDLFVDILGVIFQHGHDCR